MNHYIAVLEDNKTTSPKLTYAEACAWLDTQQPENAKVLRGFDVSSYVGDLPTLFKGYGVPQDAYVKHTRRYRNYLDIPWEWQAVSSMHAPEEQPPHRKEGIRK